MQGADPFIDPQPMEHLAQRVEYGSLIVGLEETRRSPVEP